VSDQLGTPRIVIDQTGNLAGVTRHDYLPFGEELFAGTGGRTAAMGYSGDGVRPQFSAKERDSETGLDYFNARYYGSTQGRFTSVDPIVMTNDRLVDPQTINLYGYCRNNPLAYTDPFGMDIHAEGTDELRKRTIEDIKKKTGLALTADKKGNLVYAGGTRPDGLKGAAAVIADAIDSTKTVQISLQQNNGSTDMGGPELSVNSSGGVAAGRQIIDFADLDKVNQAKISDYEESGQVVHEVVEGIGLQLKNMTYDQAHALANSYSPGADLRRDNPTEFLPPMAGAPITGFISYQQVAGGGSQFRVEYKFIKGPVPESKLPQSGRAADWVRFYQANPKAVVSVTKGWQ
jgi:RHS repeat-associated protein